MQARYAKYQLDTREVRKILDSVTSAMQVVEEVPDFCPIPRDRSDEKFTSAAIAADAEFICSADDHLLALGSCRGAEIVRAETLLRRLQERGAVI